MSAPILQRKPAKTEGGGMPQWLADHGIQPGEYQYMTKPQLRSQMRPDRPLKVQVWACGMLHTVGYRGETAYTMHRDKRVLLTPADIGKELQAEAVKFYRSAGVELTLEAVKDLRETKEVLRRTIQELERDGICERWSDGRLVREMPRSQAQRLSEKVEYRFFFTPKVAHPEVCKQEWARRTLAKSEDHREAGEVVNSNVP